jgi:acetyl esterase/lipase
MRRPWSWYGWLVLLPGVLALPACSLLDVPLWRLPPPSAATEFAVEQVRDVAYGSGSGAYAGWQRLDLILPRGPKGYPVVVLVHGGAWMGGDNRCCGLYSAVGEFLARQGIGVVLPNYRLSPEVKHPEHVKDIARAFAWTHAHIAQYGGDPGKIFLAGHSAGAHLVALLATDEQYLQAEGLQTADVKGVIAVSGVYRIAADRLDVTLGGASPRAFRLDELLPLRGDGGWGLGLLLGLPGIPLHLDVFGVAFAGDPQLRAAASPLAHIRPGLPPFLILSAEHDLPTLPQMAQEFQEALAGQGCEAQFVRVRERNHNSILFRAIDRDDPVVRAVQAFVRQHASL